MGEKQVVGHKKDRGLPLVPAGKMVLDISMFPISTLVKASCKSRINRKRFILYVSHSLKLYQECLGTE